jgi:hypothetical protein
MNFLFHMNTGTCVLGFRHLSAPASGVCVCWFVCLLFWESLQKIWSSNTLFFYYFTVSIGGGVGRFIPVVERGDPTDAWSFSNISVLQSMKKRQFVCYIRHISGMVFCEPSNSDSIMEDTSSISKRR